MGQLLHKSARTTAATRSAIQNSQESIASLARLYGVNVKTIAKWKRRTHTHDLSTGPRNPKSTVLSIEEEAAIVAFRKTTLLPLDDCLYSLQASIPHLTRSSLHRCLQRHGISKLPIESDPKVTKKKFVHYPIGYFHIDITTVNTEAGSLSLFVGIDRTTKYAYVELHQQATKIIAAQFLENLIEKVPYKIHTILTDNGIQFTNLKHQKHAFEHIFNRICRESGIKHKLTKVNHPWTNGQVERMNKTIKEATVKKYHYQTHAQLQEHLATFVTAYNFAKRLKTLKGNTPYEEIVRYSKSDSALFFKKPNPQSMGLNN